MVRYQKIIDQYNFFLDKNERKDAIVYSMAFLDFRQQKYLNAIDLLNSHSFEKPIHIIKSKSLLTRSFYEQFLKDTSYFELLIAQTYAFEKYIRRNSLFSAEKSRSYLNFIKYVRQLAISTLEKKIPENLLNSLESNSSVLCKQWLLQKIKQ